MSIKSDLVVKLTDIGRNPKNEFDKIISKHLSEIPEMSEKRLSEIYTLRRKVERLCRAVPFARKEIGELVADNAVSVHHCVAELEDCFNIAEYIFSRDE